MIREFVCKHCLHTVVVNPRLPADYTPNICRQCYEEVEIPKSQDFMNKLVDRINKLAADIEDSVYPGMQP